MSSKKLSSKARNAKWLEAMESAHLALHLAKLDEAAGNMEAARRGAELAHSYHLDARKYEE